MENILTRDGGYLTIFQKPVKIDKSLKKWVVVDESKTLDDGCFMDLGTFLNYNSDKFNIYLSARANSKAKEDSRSMFEGLLISSNESNISNQKPTFIRKIKKLVKKWADSDKDSKEEEQYEINIFEFFDNVKFTAKGNQSQYALRIEPYMIALKRANDMGQVALAEQLTAELFNNKFESILYSEGLHYKISESQIVEFVKKTEKGVRLSYISNFTNHIPIEIIEKKQKADDLKIFDNYCVLFFDPKAKSYKMTEKEAEDLRRKKSDPILFGMMNGSKNLYYVADWIDEYCDLTLDKFIEISGIDKQKLEITEKIKL